LNNIGFASGELC